MANRYVRIGAGGLGNGNNWTDAYPTIALALATVQRGDTIYLADGNYSSEGRLQFPTPVSGSTWIDIKKATATDHGISTGWLPSYGDGRATVHSVWCTTDYWRFYGNTGGFDGASLASHANHGIEILTPIVASSLQRPCVHLQTGESTGGNPVSHVRFDRCEIHFSEWGTNTETEPSGSGVGITGGSNLVRLMAGTDVSPHRDIVFHRCWIHENYSSGIRCFWVDGLTIEYCKIERIKAHSLGYHSSAVSLGAPSNLTIRWNYFVDCAGSGTIRCYPGGFIPMPAYVVDGADIYGNICIHRSLAYEGANGGFNGWFDMNPGTGILRLSARNARSWNNTIGHVGRVAGSTVAPMNFPYNVDDVDNPTVTVPNGCDCRNNLMFDAGASYVRGAFPDYNTHDDIGFSPVLPPTYEGGANDEDTSVGTAALFVDAAAENWQLAANSTPGIALPSPYDIDMFGNQRGGGGEAWSRGALQYGGAPPVVTPEVDVKYFIMSRTPR